MGLNCEWGLGMYEMKFSGTLVELLRVSTAALCEWLSDALPKLDAAWWSSLVISQLSYQQRERVERQGIDSLRHLDLAALLRVMDRNWYELSSKFNLTNLVKRHRYSQDNNLLHGNITH